MNSSKMPNLCILLPLDIDGGDSCRIYRPRGVKGVSGTAEIGQIPSPRKYVKRTCTLRIVHCPLELQWAWDQPNTLRKNVLTSLPWRATDERVPLRPESVADSRVSSGCDGPPRAFRRAPLSVALPGTVFRA